MSELHKIKKMSKTKNKFPKQKGEINYERNL